MLMFSVMKAAETADLKDISILNAAIVALLGYALVFAGLIVLMAVIVAIGKVFVLSAKNKKMPAPETKEEVAAPVAAETAPGSAGNLKLYNVEPKTAAMIMAIVADKLGKPLNELRFISIKEVE